MPDNKDKIANKIISLYSLRGFKKTFTKFKFWEEPYKEVDKVIPKEGKILDLGCGDGFFTNYLALASKNREVVGIELYKNRIKDANKGFKNVKFYQGNLLKNKIPPSDAIVFFHVLHHLGSFENQEEVLRKCYRSLSRNGVLIIVEVYVSFSFKFLLAWITDHFLFPLFFEKRLFSKIYFRKIENWGLLLKKLRFRYNFKKVIKHKPFPNVILICQKI